MAWGQMNTWLRAMKVETMSMEYDSTKYLVKNSYKLIWEEKIIGTLG